MIMRKQTLNQILKIISLILSWATLSPLLLILDGRWKLLPKWLRIVLFVLSPMILACVAAVAFLCYAYYWDYYYPRHHFVKPRVVENITGVRLPRYKVLNQGEEGRRASRFPERTYDFTLEFNKMPDEAFYNKLDEHFDSFEPGKYSYSAIWGNGMEAPKGESDQDDISFSIDIVRGSKTFHVKVMRW